jgi:hypothetical protein
MICKIILEQMEEKLGKFEQKIKHKDVGLMMDLVKILDDVLSSDEYKGSSFEYYDRIFTWDQLLFVKNFFKQNPQIFHESPKYGYTLISFMGAKDFECYLVYITHRPTWKTVTGFIEYDPLFCESYNSF